MLLKERRKPFEELRGKRFKRQIVSNIQGKPHMKVLSELTPFIWGFVILIPPL